ncbi:alpha/beta hydrolase [Mycolicibacterium litorale]|uniref:alpha/beta hydrolase n=1 Tax=Mycolicibacterium litorale TaxID=758802 RepID=UPI0039A2F96F
MIRNAPMLALMLLVLACAVDPARPDAPEGRLQSRPGPPDLPPEAPGLHELDIGGGRVALLYVPAGYRAGTPAPLVVMLHGAGGEARGGIDPLLRLADEAGMLLLAPASRRATWDVIAGGFGPDVAVIDKGLAHVFRRFAVDPGHLAVGGFSDGASYALSLGMTNGDLFTHILAFSPGFTAPGDPVGRPGIYISHGVDDRVLPIDRTSRRLLPRLQQAGYQVVYEEFPDGHTVPAAHAQRALDWFLH